MARIRDGEWSLIDHDFHLGRTVWARENGDGTTTYRTDYQVDKTLEANAQARASAPDGWKGDYHRIASIPLGLFYDKLAEAVRQDDMAYVSRFLNDHDNAKLRTKLGRV